MEQKITLITGGSGGIGSAIARACAAQGDMVVCISRTPSAEFTSYSCDITDWHAVQECVAQIIKEYGRIDHLVLGAVSPLLRKKASATDPEDFKQQFEVTTFGAFNVCKAVLPHMQQNKYGRIVGITSVALEPNIAAGSMVGYISAKFALRGLLRELAKETAPFGITVNAVAPDFVATGLHSDLPERAFELFRDKKPTKELVTPEDVAHAVVFLLSPGARAISGVSIPVSYGDGGNL